MKHSEKHGFTLMELLIVLGIIAILTAIAVPSYMTYVDKVKEEKYIMETRVVSSIIQAYVLEEYGAGRLERQMVKALMMYSLDDVNHPLAELLPEGFTEEAFIFSVDIRMETGEYLGLIYNVDGYTIEYNLEDGSIQVQKSDK